MMKKYIAMGFALTVFAGLLSACITLPAPKGDAGAPPAASRGAAEAKSSSAKPAAQLLSRDALPRYLAIPEGAVEWKEKLIYGSSRWSGDVVVRQPLVVAKTGTLTIEAGTRVFFDVPPTLREETPVPWVLVHGKLLVLGTPESPVTFSSVSIRDDERTDAFSIQGAKEARFLSAVFERLGWGIHLHDTPAEIYGCDFRDNYGGMRFKSDGMKLSGNLFERNRIGVRLLDSKDVILSGNTFRDNLTGIFFRQAIQGALVERNNFADLEYDVKLGEGQVESVQAANNFWKAQAEGHLAEKIYDAEDSQGLGQVHFDPMLPAAAEEAPK